MKQLYAITGFARSGKDTLAQYIQETCPQYQKHAFAKPLKELCARVFGLSLASFEDKSKDCELARQIAIDDFLPQLEAETALCLPVLGLVARTPREVLKYVGTQYVRSTNPKYWVEAHERTAPDHCIATDLRFANEERSVRKRGGRIIKTVRGTHLGRMHDMHESEAYVPEIEPDLLLVSHNDDLALYRRVGHLIGMGYWRMAQEHDYGCVIDYFKLRKHVGLEQAAFCACISLGTAAFFERYYAEGTIPELSQVSKHPRLVTFDDESRMVMQSREVQNDFGQVPTTKGALSVCKFHVNREKNIARRTALSTESGTPLLDALL